MNGDSQLNDLYRKYNQKPSLNEFREFCTALIRESRGSREKKAEFVHALASTQSMNRMLTSTQNYFLAGMGLRV